MIKTFYILIFFSLSILVNGQIIISKKQKIVINEKCISLKEVDVVMNEDLPITDEEFTRYMSVNYSKEFPRTTVELDVVFQSTHLPCCRRTMILDSTKIDLKQVDQLTETVLRDPDFQKIKFNGNEKAKYLTILIFGDENGKISMGLLPGFMDKQQVH